MPYRLHPLSNPVRTEDIGNKLTGKIGYTLSRAQKKWGQGANLDRTPTAYLFKSLPNLGNNSRSQTISSDIWGKPPGESLTPEAFAKREPIWNAEVIKQQEAAKRVEAEKQRRKLEHQQRREERARQAPASVPFPVAATPSIGRKFKKCCGR